ncbi:M20 family metallopeptidase [Lysinibacillus sphaericus]|uniref:Aminobenzoyl-glutamate utilization protein B n=1 Tax=Lysinibacillus sphaericus OT4b.31 TaxID=1285586 RepID=R7ZDB5_LYSSH|nr:M20 family metallopeptidase [Lysinibacillus sphaericus]EON72102.1 aminobenzoyl-glutamate utilization protein B [Lysinibacillus sphaericus OT4b.31]
MRLHEKISTLVEAKREAGIQLSDAIWAVPELHFHEEKSVQYMKEALEKEGFETEIGIANLDTALVATFGTGKPVIAFLGEYDALPGLSQRGGTTQHEPLEVGGNGHGCGHNLLGTGAFAAAVAVKDYLEENNQSATIRFYGCPAEENGSGKAYMAQAGIFDDVDIAISWHPGTFSTVMTCSSLANYAATFKFTGKSAHAAAAPHLGRSALDAVELMNVGVNYLREHIIPEARLHYAVTNTGGTSPNVVQQYAEVTYLVRAPKKHQVQEIYKRVENIAKGATLMTETSVEVVFEGAAANLIPNKTLYDIMYKQMLEIGMPTYTTEDDKHAAAIFKTFSPEVQATALVGLNKMDAIQLKDKVIADSIPSILPEFIMGGSTDVGDVSWNVPTVQCTTTCMALGTPLHTWQVVSQGVMPIAHKGMLQAAKTMACTAITLIDNPALIKEATKEWQERLDGEPYVSLIPQDATPPKF